MRGINQRTFKETMPFRIDIMLLPVKEAIETRTVPCAVMQSRMDFATVGGMRIGAGEIFKDLLKYGAKREKIRCSQSAIPEKSVIKNRLIRCNFLAKSATTENLNEMKEKEILL